MSGSREKSYLAAGPVALIIGCGDMGMGSARALGHRHPLVVVDINAALVDQSVAVLRHEGYAVEGHVCDIADKAQVARLGEALAKGPGVRVLSHVAAIGNNGASWRKVLDVDLVAVQYIADMVGPLMVPGGVAIFISSTGAQRCPVDPQLDALLDDPANPDMIDRIKALAGREPNFFEAYFMAKRGMNRLAERLAVAWGAREVRALTVSPGLIDSTMGRTSGKRVPIKNPDGSYRMGERSEMAAQVVPLQRQGTVLEVMAAIDFLASDAASFINGIDVPVDGGGMASLRTAGFTPPPVTVEQPAPPTPAQLENAAG